jgi:hypothetical protein
VPSSLLVVTVGNKVLLKPRRHAPLLLLLLWPAHSMRLLLLALLLLALLLLALLLQLLG